jgi:catabolite regulation protein CreA
MPPDGTATIDPNVEGVASHIARAQTGGVKGALGIAEDTGDASIVCRQIGPSNIVGNIKDGEARPKAFEKHPHFAVFPSESVNIMPVLPQPRA